MGPQANYHCCTTRNLHAVALFAEAIFEHYTSNMVEAANALFLEERELPAPDILHGIPKKEMGRRSSSQERALKLPVTQPLYPTVL